MEQLEFRRLLASSITGALFADYDRDGIRDTGEPGLANWQVYLDANDNGLKDSGEVSTTTSTNGAYQFTNLAAGNYVVREVLQDGWEQTSPTSAAPSAPAGITTGPEALTATDQVIFASRERYPLRKLEAYLRAHPSKLNGAVDFSLSSHILREGGLTLVELQFTESINVSRTLKGLRAMPFVQWASPNYLYQNAAEYEPADPAYAGQYQHTLIQDDAAWDITRGDSSVIIAVVDEGVDWTHPDLSLNIWQNEHEIAGNHIDDDHNGYVDDIRGWDLADNDNNPAPDTSSESHGTHVAGIAAARVDNNVGIAGVAGLCSIMPVRVIDPQLSFSSARVAAGYRYAVDNGAKIVVSSFNTDAFVNDPVYQAGLQYLYDHGALHFNSAGNSDYMDPPRQAFDQSILVASTDATDIRNSSSSYGWGIDLSAPGTSILSTMPGGGYAYMSGTSMAAPMAAGVAALMWSAFPQYTREQVAARLLGTANVIDQFNAGYEGKLGSGRVNALRALTATLAAPRFASDAIIGLPAAGGTTMASPSSFTLSLASVFDPASIANASNWALTGDGPDNQFGTGDDVNVQLSLQTSYAVATNRLNFSMSPLLPDTYRFVARSGTNALRNPFGQALDGDNNGSAGGDFVRTFTVLAQPTAVRVSLASNQNFTAADFGVAERNALQASGLAFSYIVDQSGTITFSKPIASPLQAGDIELRNLTTGDVIPSSLFVFKGKSNDRYQEIQFGNQSRQLPDGRYVLTVRAASGVRDAYGNALAHDTKFSFFVLGADASRDAVIDSIDLNIFLSAYGSGDNIFSHGDFNYDRKIDTLDFGILAGNWGKFLAAVGL